MRAMTLREDVGDLLVHYLEVSAVACAGAPTHPYAGRGHNAAIVAEVSGAGRMAFDLDLLLAYEGVRVRF